MDVYDRIDQRIAEQHLSRRQLAQQIGVAPSTFQSMMARKRGLTFDMLGKITERLNSSIQDFCEDEPDTQKPAAIVEWTQEAEERISAALEKLNTTGQNVAVERVEELTKIPDYQK